MAGRPQAKFTTAPINSQPLSTGRKDRGGTGEKREDREEGGKEGRGGKKKKKKGETIGTISQPYRGNGW